MNPNRFSQLRREHWQSSDSKTLEVLVSRGHRGELFAADGTLLARRSYEAREFSTMVASLPPLHEKRGATSPWLYLFSNSFLSFLVGMVGGLGLAVGLRAAERTTIPGPPRRGPTWRA